MATRGQDNNARGDENAQGNMRMMACDNLTAGETLTLSGLTGHYINASASAADERSGGAGNASATLTFKVSAVYAEGCSLSLSSGSFRLNTTSYAITGGSIVLNHGGRSGEGTGTTSSGSFLIFVAGLHGNSTTANAGAVRLDFKTGTSQFLVNLHSANPASTGDRDNGD